MHWNRKMRSLRRLTLKQADRLHRQVGRMWMKELQWLGERLFSAAGRPPQELFDHAECEDCEHFYEPRYCGGCWVKVAEDAVDKEDA